MIYKYCTEGVFDYYFLVFKKPYSRKKFLEKIKVKKDSYAESIFIRIYDTLISEVVDIRKEFMKYYYKEYENIKDFLYKKYNVDDIYLIDILMEKIENGYQVFHAKKNSSMDYSISQLIFSDTMLEKLNTLFKKGEKA